VVKAKVATAKATEKAKAKVKANPHLAGIKGLTTTLKTTNTPLQWYHTMATILMDRVWK
jgi:hypothetical protein